MHLIFYLSEYLKTHYILSFQRMSCAYVRRGIKFYSEQNQFIQ